MSSKNGLFLLNITELSIFGLFTCSPHITHTHTLAGKESERNGAEKAGKKKKTKKKEKIPKTS